jgi:hypothetical protein
METRTLMKTLLLLLLLSGIAGAQFAVDNTLLNNSTSFYVVGYAEFKSKIVRDNLWSVIVNYPKIQNNTMRGGYADFPEAGYYDIRIEFIVNDSGKIANFVSGLETLRTNVQTRRVILNLFYCDTLITDWTDIGNKYTQTRMSIYTR